MPQSHIHSLIKHHAMQTCWGSGGIAPCILDLSSRWRWMVKFTPQQLYSQEKKPQYPLDRGVGWAPETVWKWQWGKKFHHFSHQE